MIEKEHARKIVELAKSEGITFHNGEFYKNGKALDIKMDTLLDFAFNPIALREKFKALHA